MKSNEACDLQKHTLHLYPGDYARLRELFPDVPTALVIRRLIRAHIEAVEGKAGNMKVKVVL